MYINLLKCTYLCGALFGVIACNIEAPKPRPAVKCNPNIEKCATETIIPKTDPLSNKTVTTDKTSTETTIPQTTNPQVTSTENKSTPPQTTSTENKPAIETVPPETVPVNTGGSTTTGGGSTTTTTTTTTGGGGSTPPPPSVQTCVTNTELNVRSGANWEPVIATLPNNASVTIIEKSATKCASAALPTSYFVKIQYQNTTGYSCGEYIICK